MELGAVSTVFIKKTLEEAAQRMHALGLKFIELGAGGYFPKDHCNPAQLLANPADLDRFQQILADSELRVSAFAIHGEPLNPNPAIARAYDEDFQSACALAARIGVTRLTLLAGLPEAVSGDEAPNWILYPFPARNLEMHEWQWKERLIPYWREHGKIAEDHGIRLCFEMVPADMVYKPEALLRLRDAIGPVIGCNLDPSHLLWQGMDMPEVIRSLGKTIYHTHAKDCLPDPHNVRTNGILDAKDFSNMEHRSWLFRAVGFGHPELFWRDYVSTLRLVGYDDVVSIEHEDPLIDSEEGFELAVSLLQHVLIRKTASGVWSDRVGSREA